MYVTTQQITISIYRKMGSSNRNLISAFRVTGPTGLLYNYSSFDSNGVPGDTWDGLFRIRLTLGIAGLYTCELLQSNNAVLFHKFLITVVPVDTAYIGYTN